MGRGRNSHRGGLRFQIAHEQKQKKRGKWHGERKLIFKNENGSNVVLITPKSQCELRKITFRIFHFCGLNRPCLKALRKKMYADVNLNLNFWIAKKILYPQMNRNWETLSACLGATGYNDEKNDEKHFGGQWAYIELCAVPLLKKTHNFSIKNIKIKILLIWNFSLHMFFDIFTSMLW